MAFPENFSSLHAQEEGIRKQSIAAIEACADLSLHAEALEGAMNALDHFSRGFPTNDQDSLTVQLLGIRLFNTSASVLKLLLSGYYQTSAAQMRDGIETANLIDYFTTDCALIAKWRGANDRDRWKEFKPVKVRAALGQRDGPEITKRRDEVYRTFSTYANHPSPAGFRLLRPSADGLALIGPFFERSALAALVSEVAKSNVPAAMSFVRHFTPATRDDHLTAIGFIELSDRWSAHFYGTPFEPEKFIELRRLVDLRPPSGGRDMTPASDPRNRKERRRVRSQSRRR